MDKQAEIKKVVENLLKQLKSSQLDYQNIELIIERSIKQTDRFSDKSHVLRTISEQISFSFGINPHLLYDYLQVPIIVTISELSLDTPTYKKILEFINNIKIKYGVFINSLLVANREPFSITGVETSVGHNESMHVIRFIRGDGQVLEGMFKPAALMAILASLTDTLKISLERGIYNLDKNVIELYLGQSEELKKLLNQLLESENK